MSLAYLHLLSNLLKAYQSQILKLEKSHLTIIETKLIISDTISMLQTRVQNEFIPKIIIDNFESADINKKKIDVFKEEALNLYKSSLSYLEKWTANFSKFVIFQWMLLIREISWTEIQKTSVYLDEICVTTDDNKLIDQFTILNNFVKEKLKNEKDTWAEISCEERWAKFFSNHNFPEQHSELLICCEYMFSLPAHNADVERIFSEINAQWTKDRNKLEIETINAILMCKFNINMKCRDFYDYLKSNKTLLRAAKSADKYNK